jgi:hypothetical protein
MPIELNTLAAWKRQAQWSAHPRRVVLALIEEVERLAIQVEQLEEDNARLEAELEVTSRDLDRIARREGLPGPSTC